MAQAIEQIIARRDSGAGKPYKGRLIDTSTYQGDGTEPPENIGCRCAAWATNEIQGTSIMRESGQPFFFLPMFGFAAPEEIDPRAGAS